MSQPYQELAEADKQRSIREYLAYQEPDMYKQFIRNKHPTLKKQKPRRRSLQASLQRRYKGEEGGRGF